MKSSKSTWHGLEPASGRAPRTSLELEMALFEWQHQKEEEMNQQRLRNMTDVIAGMAHELSTPVGIGVTVTSHLRQLNEACVTKISQGEIAWALEKQQEIAQGLELLENSLQRVVGDLRSLKKLAVNKNTPSESLCLNQALQTVIQGVRDENTQKDCVIRLDVDPELNLYVRIDAINDIFSNLIGNSLTHGFGASNENQIEIRAFRHHGSLTIGYSDNGKGIHPEVLPRIFDAFYTTRRCEGHMGLGLNIVYNWVVYGLGGTIQCQSTPGNGVHFTLCFPETI